MNQNEKRQALIEMVLGQLNGAVRGLNFEVVEAAVRRDNGWWYVPVLLEDEGGTKPTHDLLVNLYANVEEDVSTKLKTNVLLVPASQR